MNVRVLVASTLVLAGPMVPASPGQTAGLPLLDEPIRPVHLSLEQDPPVGPAQTEQAAGGHSSQNEANNPLTPKITINFHNYFIPSFYGLDDKESNQFLFRGVIPHALFGAPQIFRFTLPVVYAPDVPVGYETGLGDLTLIDYVVFKGGGMEFALGPMFVAPTATDDPLGQGKWQIGASGLAIAPQHWGLIGGVVNLQQSFAGDNDRDDVTLLTVQPLIIHNLPAGFYLRSTAIWNFDLNNDSYYIPIGLGAGKVFQCGDVTINAFVEPQYTVFHDEDTVAPQWQIFAGVNFQFSMR